VVSTSYIPNVILPKPAFSVNMAPPKPREGPKFNLPTMTVSRHSCLLRCVNTCANPVVCKKPLAYVLPRRIRLSNVC
jgi:hypothetical protein